MIRGMQSPTIMGPRARTARARMGILRRISRLRDPPPAPTRLATQDAPSRTHPMSKPPAFAWRFPTSSGNPSPSFRCLMEIGLYHHLRPWMQNRAACSACGRWPNSRPRCSRGRSFGRPSSPSCWTSTSASSCDPCTAGGMRRRGPKTNSKRSRRSIFAAARRSSPKSRRGFRWDARPSAARWSARIRPCGSPPIAGTSSPGTSPIGQVERTFARPRPRRFVTWVVGTPDPLVIALNDGSEQVFHVADPSQVLSWLSSSST